MKARRKMLISLLTVSFVLLSVVATVAIAFALTQHTITTTLNIGYTVEDIDGSVKASYTIGTSTEHLTAMKGDQAQGNILYFKAGDTENAGNLVFPDGEIPLTAQNDNIIIQYTYANTGEKHYIASMDFNAELVSENMTVEYSIDGVTYSEDRYAVVVPANSSDKNYWIRIKITDKAKSASFKGDFNWLLSGCDEQEESYLSLTSLEFKGSDGAYSASVVSSGSYAGQLIFPSSVNNDPVTTISASSLTQAQKNQITSAYIPDSVETIGNSAFSQFKNMQTITFEQNEQSTGASVQSESGLKSIGYSAFYNCSSLKEIELPDTLETIEYDAFSGCSSLESLIIGSKLTNIRNAFMVFSGCTSLSKIEVAKDNPKYSSSGNCLIENKTILLGCSTSVIPQDLGITTIGDYAFYKCKIKNVTIPNTVTEIRLAAFDSCKNLTSIEIPDSVTRIVAGAFGGCSSLNNVNLGKGVIYLDGFTNCTSLTSIEIPASVKELTGFGGCTNLETVKISEGVTQIGEGAFDSCSNLVTVELPNSLTAINARAFFKCSKLTNCVLPTSLQTIGNEAFSGCSSLETLTIPSSVRTIGEWAFCSAKLTNLTIENGVTTIGGFAFAGAGVVNVVIPDSVISLAGGEFNACPNLESVTFGKGVNYIDASTIDQCPKLTSVTVDSGNAKYKSAGNCLIEKSTKTLIKCLANGVIPTDGSVTIIGGIAFSGTGLTSIVIPDVIETVKNGAFFGLNLETVVFGTGVKTIEAGAFSRYNENLTSVTFKNPNGWTVAEMGSWYPETEMTSEQLSDPETVASYFKDAVPPYYIDRAWTRK